MALQNLGYLIERREKAGEKFPLFDITILGLRFKCLFLTEEFTFKFLIVVQQPKSRGIIAHFNSKGEQLGVKFLLPEFYRAIRPTLAQLDNGNQSPKPDVFWKAFDEKLLNVKITDTSYFEACDMLRTTSTADKRLDEGNKPFFLSFARRKVRSVTEKNLEKTEYCLGKKYRELCKRNKFSTCWTDDVAKPEAACFFDPILLEKKFNDTLNKSKHEV